jgi:hypothetical protein
MFNLYSDIRARRYFRFDAPDSKAGRGRVLEVHPEYLFRKNRSLATTGTYTKKYYQLNKFHYIFLPKVRVL